MSRAGRSDRDGTDSDGARNVKPKRAEQKVHWETGRVDGIMSKHRKFRGSGEAMEAADVIDNMNRQEKIPRRGGGEE